jgi:hypothetical protein
MYSNLSDTENLNHKNSTDFDNYSKQLNILENENKSLTEKLQAFTK